MPITPTRKVLSHTSLPSRLPITGAACAWLLMDRFAAPGWAIGAVLTMYVLVAVVALIERWNEVPMDAPGFGNDTLRPRRSIGTPSLEPMHRHGQEQV